MKVEKKTIFIFTLYFLIVFIVICEDSSRQSDNMAQKCYLLYSYEYLIIKTVVLKPSNKCADITRYRHAYSILHTYSDAFACCRYMTLLKTTSNVHDVAGISITRNCKNLSTLTISRHSISKLGIIFTDFSAITLY